MNRFDRQERIAGWKQEGLAAASVLVCGRDWVGTAAVWALASLGVGRLTWVGACRPATQRLADTFLAEPPPFEGVQIADFPFAADYGPELEWAAQAWPPAVVVCASDDPREVAVCRAFAQRGDLPCFVGGAGGFGLDTPPPSAPEGQNPVDGLLLGAVLADAVRETLAPLHDGLLPPPGPLDLGPPPPIRPTTAVLVGVGGIGVYAATALTARGWRLVLLDDDVVEYSNLNRQGLFTVADVRDRRPKAEAARDALRRWFPEMPVDAEARRVGADDLEYLRRLRPDVLLSAVDNAATRLLLQDFGRRLGIPVVQAGTDVFAADCFVQTPTGPTLDAQTHGALTAAATREGDRRRRGGCAMDPSYVVPGVVAGALMADRAARAVADRGPVPPARWRAGDLPAETRSAAHAFDLSDVDPHQSR